MAARPATPASPKNHKVRGPQPGQPLYGCGKPCLPVPVSLPPHQQKHPPLTVTRTPAETLQPRPSDDQYLDPALQVDPAEHLRHDPPDPADSQGHRRPDRHIAHPHIPLPAMPLDTHRGGPDKARHQEVPQILYVGKQVTKSALGWSGIRGLLTTCRCRLEERLPLLPDV